MAAAIGSRTIALWLIWKAIYFNKLTNMKFTFSHRIIGAFLAIAVLSIFVGYFAFIATNNLQRVSKAIKLFCESHCSLKKHKIKIAIQR